jgi:hypothetical protein
LCAATTILSTTYISIYIRVIRICRDRETLIDSCTLELGYTSTPPILQVPQISLDFRRRSPYIDQAEEADKGAEQQGGAPTASCEWRRMTVGPGRSREAWRCHDVTRLAQRGATGSGEHSEDRKDGAGQRYRRGRVSQG